MSNIAFKALLNQRQMNQVALAARLEIPESAASDRINSKMDWRWPEVCTVCNALGITFDEFAAYFPGAPVKQSTPQKAKTDREQLADALQLAANILKKGQNNGIQ